ncbi:MAG: hypothetical protein SH857_11350 [Chitinophagales bacterium]|mgnify:CR=1 FL=1|nr:hypothetical protein [Chitinophagales bacterium]
MAPLPKHEYSEIRDKILEGIQKAFEKLVRQAAENDGELIFSENKKIRYVKARELLKTIS